MAAEPTTGERKRFPLRATGAVARRQRISRGSTWVLLAASLLGFLVLLALLADVVMRGGHVLVDSATVINWDFFTSYPSRFAEQAGIRSSLLGWVWVMGVTVIVAIPVGVGAAIWIEEFAPRNAFTTVVQLNIANLAGVPSIIYGILGLAVFVRLLGLGPAILAGGITLALMILPMTIIASQEAIRQVPESIRQASLAVGATRWQTVWHHVLPAAIPGIMTGSILAISRAAGETAALIMIGAFTFIAFDPEGVLDDFTTLPIQVYNWTIRPTQQGFQDLAAAAIIVLLVVILCFNLIATIIRERFRRY